MLIGTYIRYTFLLINGNSIYAIIYKSVDSEVYYMVISFLK